MRSVVLALVLAAVSGGCDRAETKKDPQPSTKPDDGQGSSADADRYKEEQAQFDRERRPDLVVAALALGPGRRVADIGAGSGLFSVHLARAVLPDGKVIATDIDPAPLNLLTARIRANGLEHIVEPRVVKEDEPGLEAGAFDAILLSQVDQYFDDPVEWLQRAAPALKPGGRLVIVNRIDRKTKSLAAAKQAGLTTVSVTSPIPTHFIAIYNRP
jgi:ubiquinone/menaquinone biosynthesis C-methylase UbiE